jgi:predicted O-methyltransferase YrrM
MPHIADQLLPFFPDAVVHTEKPDRSDRFYCDKQILPHCGFISVQESEALFRVAGEYPGLWTEIGSHVGWSAAVIASAGCDVKMVDPAYADPESPAKQRAYDNFARAKLLRRGFHVGEISLKYFTSEGSCDKSMGFFIDGDHGWPNPLYDAICAWARLGERGVIVLHDFVGEPVKEAVRYLKEQGMRIEIFEGMQGLAICRKG